LLFAPLFHESIAKGSLTKDHRAPVERTLFPECNMAQSIYDIPVSRIDGQKTSLGAYRGKVLLVVNVASKCGLTPQYTGLQSLYSEKHAKGLEILGFPANNFGGQEPGTEAEIKDFCSTNYAVEFPLFQKISVLGDDRHPLYNELVAAQPKALGVESMRERLGKYGIKVTSDTDVLWNFEKFVIDRNGKVIARFSPDIAADDPRLTGVLDKALAN
jgi:glutathione peroxidase